LKENRQDIYSDRGPGGALVSSSSIASRSAAANENMCDLNSLPSRSSFRLLDLVNCIGNVSKCKLVGDQMVQEKIVSFLFLALQLTGWGTLICFLPYLVVESSSPSRGPVRQGMCENCSSVRDTVSHTHPMPTSGSPWC
jgi:hypothetical protein